MLQSINPALLEYSWTAEIVQKNGQTVTIWHTAWHSTKHIVAKINWIASDFPRYKRDLSGSILLGY